MLENMSKVQKVLSLVYLEILALMALEKKVPMVSLLKKMMAINIKYQVLGDDSKTGLVTTDLV